MLVHRVLDVFFRTLDAVDAVKDRVDRVLGRAPRPDPWAVEWPPVDDDGAKATEAPRVDDDAGPAKPTRAPRVEPPAKRAASVDATPSTSSKRSKAGRKKSASANRKGSVDRVGADLDSPRARAIHTRVQESQLPILDEASEVNGKKVLARALWALSTAELAGSEKGLTTNDMAALLHLAAGIEVFATNIGRACRDHDDLITESEPDGRTRRYVLTDEGRAVARSISAR